MISSTEPTFSSWWWCLLEGDYSICCSRVFTAHHLPQYSLCAQIFPDGPSLSHSRSAHAGTFPPLLVLLLDVWHAGSSFIVVTDENLQQGSRNNSWLMTTSVRWFMCLCSVIHAGCLRGDEGFRLHRFRPETFGLLLHPAPSHPPTALRSLNYSKNQADARWICSTDAARFGVEPLSRYASCSMRWAGCFSTPAWCQDVWK